MIKQIVRNISCCDQKYFHSPAKFLYQLLGSGGDVAGEVDGVNALEDDVVGLHGVGAGEGRGPGQQLEHEDAEAPVVSRDVVALVEDNLGRHVLGGAAEGPGLAPDLKMWTARVKNTPSVAVILFLLPSVNFPTDGLRSADEPGLGLLSYVKSIFSPRSKQIKLCNQTRSLHSQ